MFFMLELFLQVFIFMFSGFYMHLFFMLESFYICAHFLYSSFYTSVHFCMYIYMPFPPEHFDLSNMAWKGLSYGSS